MANDKDIETLALEAIDRSSLIDTLTTIEGAPERVPFSWIYSFVCNSAEPPTDAFMDRILTDPQARKSLEALSSKMARAEIVAAAAASTQIDERVSDTATVRLIKATERPDQIFVKAQLNDSSRDAASILLVVDSSENWHRLNLVPYSDGVSQALIEVGAPIVAALRDPGSRIRLL